MPQFSNVVTCHIMYLVGPKDSRKHFQYYVSDTPHVKLRLIQIANYVNIITHACKVVYPFVYPFQVLHVDCSFFVTKEIVNTHVRIYIGEESFKCDVF